MNRNTESRFALNPTNITISRSTFSRNSQHKTTFNAGKLIPVYVDEVLPGDTFEMNTSAIVRMSTPIFPVMDNADLDFYWFFVPNRLVWDHWKEFNGENTTTAWEQTTEYEIPQMAFPNGTNKNWEEGSLADYMGIPIVPSTQQCPETINHLPFRAYCLIWNEWFRDQNLQDPVLIDTGDSETQGERADESGSNYQQSALKGGSLLPVNKYHDYFTSCLPEPQKGPAVLLPLGTEAPIRTSDTATIGIDEYPVPSLKWSATTGPQLIPGNSAGGLGVKGIGSSASPGLGETISISGEEPGTLLKPVPANLYADLTQATAATINELRMAFQIQKLYERDARGGTRYREIIKSHFGVTSPDARMQIPEYLGGERVPINIDQVLQTSGTTDTSPQGNTAAYSLTGFQKAMFTKSFTEHGYLFGLCCVRNENTYQQGLERMWSRKRRFDFYWPALANIGEQAVLNKEIYLATDAEQNDEAFGYQEAWAEYRYKPSRVSAAMRSDASSGSLDTWHYADDYTELPTLSDEWIQSDPANIGRTLAVQDEYPNQFIADFYFKCDTTRPMPVYSVPGLIDHN